MERRLFSLAVSLTVVACADSQVGHSGWFRLGLDGDYPEADNLELSFAKGQLVTLSVHALNKSALLGDHPLVESTLTLVSSAGVAIDVEAKERGRFTTVFPAAGRYEATARADGRVDGWALNVAEQTGLRPSREGFSLLTNDHGRLCSTPVETTSSLPMLAPNQSIRMSLVPVDARGAALVGLLDLDFAESQVRTHRPPLSVHANSYELEPYAPVNGMASTTVTDRVTGQTTNFTFAIAATRAVCPEE